MTLSLRALVKKPESKWFHYAGMRRVDSEKDADLSLHIKYMSKGEYQRMISAAVVDSAERKAVTKRGLKAFVRDDDVIQRAMCENMVLGWKLTVRGAFSLQAECDFAGLAPSTDITFNKENMDVMIEHSNLAATVNSIVENHANWFEFEDSEEDSAKNSASGGSSSSDEQAAPPASTAT